jgi:GABA permease/S-methylmethionine transporter
MMMEVSFLIEMSIANPVAGAFKVYAHEVFGEWWGYVIGWMFWTSGILGMASEIIACAIFMRLWFPAIELWMFSLVFSVLITLINLNDLKGLSKIELGLASVKVTTLILFILAGILILSGVRIGQVAADFTPFLTALQAPQQGILGLLASMLLILFAYTGTGIIGIAATETQFPEKTVPQATKVITISVVAMYTLSTFFIIALLPHGAIDVAASPFVTLFRLVQIPYASDVVNFILLTAALSSLNSQVYSSSRMLFSLATHGQAPKFTAYQSKKGVPTAAVWLSGAFLLCTALLSYVLPDSIFIYTVSASGFLALINWMSVSATHYYYRKKILATAPEKLKYKAPFYPYLSWICFFTILIAVLSAALYPDQLPGLYAGVIILIIISLSYILIPNKSKQ